MTAYPNPPPRDCAREGAAGAGYPRTFTGCEASHARLARDATALGRDTASPYPVRVMHQETPVVWPKPI